MSEPFENAPARVGVCLGSSSDREAMQRWLSGAPHLQLSAEVDGRTDLVLADMDGLRAHLQRLINLREQRSPGILPVLLLLPGGRSLEGIDEIAQYVDDIIRAPVNPRELRFRIRSALRARWLSVQLRQSMEFEQRLVGIVGHDMRSPLSVLTMVADMLELVSPQNRDQMGKYRERIERATSTLARLADDLLIVATGRSGGRISLAPTDCELDAIAAGAVELVPHSERIAIELDGDPRARLDRERVQQLLINLVQNALRHGEADAPVTIVVDGRTRDTVELSVVNEGRIDAASRASLFDAFRQGGGARRSLGVGLGLYIVDAIARAHGGRVRVDSEDNTVAFRVQLPRRA